MMLQRHGLVPVTFGRGCRGGMWGAGGGAVLGEGEWSHLFECAT